MNRVDLVETSRLRRDIPPFRPGDTVRVHVKVREGQRERLQVFEGVVISRRGGGLRESFTVRKLSFGVGVERTFPIHAPVIDHLEVVRHGDVRRAKLYYLRGLTGRAARIAERRGRIRTLEDIVPTDGQPEELTPEAIEEAVAAAAAAEQTVDIDGAEGVTVEDAEAIEDEIAEGGPVPVAVSEDPSDQQS